MIVEALYHHKETGRESYTKQRVAEGDEIFVRFIPSDGETLPFDGETMIPLQQFADWMEERSAYAEALTTLGILPLEGGDGDE